MSVSLSFCMCLCLSLVCVGRTTHEDVFFDQDNGWRDEFGSCNISPPRRMDLQVLAVNDPPNFVALSGNLDLQVMPPSSSITFGPNTTLQPDCQSPGCLMVGTSRSCNLALQSQFWLQQSQDCFGNFCFGRSLSSAKLSRASYRT